MSDSISVAVRVRPLNQRCVFDCFLCNVSVLSHGHLSIFSVLHQRTLFGITLCGWIFALCNHSESLLAICSLEHREIDGGAGTTWLVEDNTITQCASSGKPISEASYSFDKIFNTGIKTQEVYESIAKNIVLQAMEGFNGTIFAYGQTSSGLIPMLKFGCVISEVLETRCISIHCAFSPLFVQGKHIQ